MQILDQNIDDVDFHQMVYTYFGKFAIKPIETDNENLRQAEMFK